MQILYLQTLDDICFGNEKLLTGGTAGPQLETSHIPGGDLHGRTPAAGCLCGGVPSLAPRNRSQGMQPMSILRGTMRFGSTTKVVAKRVLKYYRML